MQFNPACLSSNGTITGQSINSSPNTPQTPQAEYVNNNVTAYSDCPVPQWPNSVISLPVFGIYNSSLIAVPEAGAPSNQANNDTAALAKKKIPKRVTQGGKSGDDAKTDDKNQGLDEEQRLKRQRRLIKNREAAQQFRQRQKEYIQNLERRVGELNTHVGETHKHIELLTAENRLLRDQLVYLYNVMRQNLSLTTTNAAPSPFASIPNPVPSPTPPPPPPAATQQQQLNGLIDLSLLGFKGLGLMDSNVPFEELMKTNQGMALMAQMQSLPPQSLPPQPSPPAPQSTPPPSQSLAGNKGMEIDTSCDGMSNPMYITRYGNVKTGEHNEPQTVPDMMVKPEGGGAGM